MAEPTSPPPVFADDPWLTVPQVSAELKLNPATVRLWARSGRLGAVRVGNAWRVRRSDLERALGLNPSQSTAADSGSSAPEAPAGAPVPAPRQIADHILTVTPAADGE